MLFRMREIVATGNFGHRFGPAKGTVSELGG